MSNWSLAELNRFHPACLFYNMDELGGIKASVTLPVDKPEQELALLAASLPEVRLWELTTWVVRVDPKH